MFEDYLPTFENIVGLKSCQTILEQKGLKWCLEWAIHHSENIHRNDEKKKYSYFLSCIAEIYYALDQMINKNEIMNSNMGIVIKMINVMKKLDNDCGTEEGIVSTQSNEQNERILIKLDEDRILFKQILMESMKDNELPDYALLFILSFAELIFKFNGYQAPPRLNPVDAFNDSLGLTDLFDELMNEIFTELGRDEIPQIRSLNELDEDETSGSDDSIDSDNGSETDSEDKNESIIIEKN